jgi:Host cell surface-exposed lipoprotein
MRKAIAIAATGLTALAIGACATSSGSTGGHDESSKAETVAATHTSTTATKSVPADAKENPTPDKPEMTSGQENAVQVAQDYIDMSGFSKAGLIDQLSSSAGEGFSKADATFAANNVDADWNAEAVESAKDYLDMGGMSKSGLIEQLSSSAGEQFTPEQAQYAADKAY